MRNAILGGCLLAAAVLLASNVGYAHGTWVVKRSGAWTVVLGEGADDQGYNVAKVKKVTAYSKDFTPTRVVLDARQEYVTLNPPKDAAILVVEFDHGYWTKGGDGKYVNKPMTEVPGAKAASRNLKYNVAYLDPAVQPKALDELPIQIVPLVNPASLKQGDTLEVQVLHQGKPLADAEIIVDVVGDLGNTVTTNADGKATVPVRNMGLNVIGVEPSFPLEGSDWATTTGYFATISFVAAK